MKKMMSLPGASVDQDVLDLMRRLAREDRHRQTLEALEARWAPVWVSAEFVFDFTPTLVLVDQVRSRLGSA